MASAFAKKIIGVGRKITPFAVMAPSLSVIVVCVYGFIAWSVALSLTNSRIFPRFEFAGVEQYVRLFADDRWQVAVKNMAIFGVLYVGVAAILGLFIAILIDQRIRLEGFFRAAFLYPMALSFVVTGVIWQWILNPGLGLEKLAHDLGWESFRFQWLIDPDMAIYTLVIAGVWQVTGFMMALFLAGLRGIDSEILKAAKIDGASLWKTYVRIIIPALRPVFMTVMVIGTHLAIKSYDLVVALTKGGPGIATELPSTFMYTFTFTRSNIGLGSASAVMMLMALAAIIVPYLYSELRHDRR